MDKWLARLPDARKFSNKKTGKESRTEKRNKKKTWIRIQIKRRVLRTIPSHKYKGSCVENKNITDPLCTGVPTAQFPSMSVHVGMDNRSNQEKSKFELIGS